MLSEKKSGRIEESGLKVFILLTVFILFLEVFGGIFTKSLALLSDASHVLMDLLALALAYLAIHFARKPPTAKATYGYHRFEVIASLINSLTLVAISVWIFYEAYVRISSPLQIRGTEMLAIATIGFAANGYVALKLRKFKSDLNIRAAYLHVITDTLSSLGVIIAAIWISLTGNYLIDPVVSFIIGGVVAVSSARLLYECFLILMQHVPRYIDMDELAKNIRGIKGVKDVHDVHVWTLCPHIHMLTAHVQIKTRAMQEKILSDINRDVEKKYCIEHTTIQFELKHCGNKDSHNHKGTVL